MNVQLPPPLHAEAHKGDAGRLLVIAGSEFYPGAARLCVEAALRGGAGLVTLGHFHAGLPQIVAAAVPEVTYLDLSRTRDLFAGRLPREISSHRHDVRVVGPGLGQGGHSREFVQQVVSDSFSGGLVLDADALNVLDPEAEVSAHPGPVWITPHPGEAKRLLGESIPGRDGDRREACEELARRHGAICILKGHRTVVSDGARHWVCEAGNPGMATAGTGDVLSGVLGAYAARVSAEYDAFAAACAAVFVHARAGDLAAEALGQRGMIARDVIEHLPAAQRL